MQIVFNIFLDRGRRQGPSLARSTGPLRDTAARAALQRHRRRSSSILQRPTGRRGEPAAARGRRSACTTPTPRAQWCFVRAATRRRSTRAILADPVGRACQRLLAGIFSQARALVPLLPPVVRSRIGALPWAFWGLLLVVFFSWHLVSPRPVCPSCSRCACPRAARVEAVCVFACGGRVRLSESPPRGGRCRPGVGGARGPVTRRARSGGGAIGCSAAHTAAHAHRQQQPVAASLSALRLCASAAPRPALPRLRLARWCRRTATAASAYRRGGGVVPDQVGAGRPRTALVPGALPPSTGSRRVGVGG